jgi:hypothetical protein
VLYGGEPEDDFYWTAGVKDMLYRPFVFMRNTLVDHSRLLQLLGAKLGFINSARLVRSDIDPRLVKAAAEYYIKIRAYTESICKAYAIKCIFIIQPTALLERTGSESAKRTTQAFLRWFPSAANLYQGGYDYIFRKAGYKVRDASHLDEGKDQIYTEFVHLNKRGSKLIGEYIRSTLQ